MPEDEKTEKSAGVPKVSGDSVTAPKGPKRPKADDIEVERPRRGGSYQSVGGGKRVPVSK